MFGIEGQLVQIVFYSLLAVLIIVWITLRRLVFAKIFRIEQPTILMSIGYFIITLILSFVLLLMVIKPIAFGFNAI